MLQRKRVHQTVRCPFERLWDLPSFPFSRTQLTGVAFETTSKTISKTIRDVLPFIVSLKMEAHIMKNFSRSHHGGFILEV